MHVNFHHGCSGEREKSDYGFTWTRNEITFVAVRITRARFLTRFLGTMNRISSVFRRNSSSAVMTSTLMGCVISHYRINFPSENFRRWIIHRSEKNITKSCKKINNLKKIQRYLKKKNSILMYQVWSGSLSSLRMIYGYLKMLSSLSPLFI